MTWLDPREWPASDYWCTICDRGDAEREIGRDGA